MATLLEEAPKTAFAMLDYNRDAETDLIRKARALQPMLLAHAAHGDEQGILHPDVFTALTQAGFWAMAAPRRWGGTGTSARAMALVGYELAKGDPSVGWVYTVLHGTTWVASLGPDALQEAIFGAGAEHPVICGIANPPGTLDEVEGGYIVNGRWPYASGSRRAAWRTRHRGSSAGSGSHPHRRSTRRGT